MTKHHTPNLFSFATSELSQDAFICWLAAWADPKFKEADLPLHQTGQAFVLSMIKKHKPEYDVAEIKTVDIKRQADKLDVLIEINKELESKLAILVEDKTHTSNHSDQLNRYYTQIKGSGYTEDQMIPLYFKTGYQSRFDTIGIFKSYLRSDFLTVLRTGAETVKSDIYHDFLVHLEKMDSIIQQFSTKDIKDWQATDWIGFYMVLYETIADDEANWSYVANPSGGFYGYWWHFKRNLSDKKYTPYIQLEQDSLCFKIEVIQDGDRRNAREEAFQLIDKAGDITRPERMGNGKYMTVARWTGDYRVVKDGKIDFDATLENLRKAQQVLDAAFPR